MRIAVMGSGGLGGFCGALLSRAGQDVTLIARGPHLKAIQDGGLTIKSPVVGEFTVMPMATDSPDSVGEVDLVVMGVKTYDVPAAIELVHPMVGKGTLLVSLQNGIEAAEQIAAAFEADRVAVAISYINSLVESPGVIRHGSQHNELILGGLKAGRSAALDEAAAVLNEASIDCDLREDISIPRWEKFVLLAGTGGVMALTRLSLGPIRDCAETSALFQGVVSEACEVGRAAGVPLDENLVDHHWQLMQTYPASASSSMLFDIRAGRRLELESLNGAIVRLGAKLGVRTPLNFAVYAALKPYVDGEPVAATD